MDREKLLEINRQTHENLDNSIFLYPSYEDHDEVAITKLRQYFVSRRKHPPECEARKFWDKFVNLTDVELLNYWHDDLAWKKRSEIEIAAINKGIAKGIKHYIKFPSSCN